MGIMYEKYYRKTDLKKNLPLQVVQALIYALGDREDWADIYSAVENIEVGDTPDGLGYSYPLHRWSKMTGVPMQEIYDKFSQFQPQISFVKDHAFLNGYINFELDYPRLAEEILK